MEEDIKGLKKICISPPTHTHFPQRKTFKTLVKKNQNQLHSLHLFPNSQHTVNSVGNDSAWLGRHL